MNRFPCQPRHLITYNSTPYMAAIELCCTIHGKLGQVEIPEHMFYPDSPARPKAESKLREIWQKHVSPDVETNPLELAVHLL